MLKAFVLLKKVLCFYPTINIAYKLLFSAKLVLYKTCSRSQTSYNCFIFNFSNSLFLQLRFHRTLKPLFKVNSVWTPWVVMEYVFLKLLKISLNNFYIFFYFDQFLIFFLCYLNTDSFNLFQLIFFQSQNYAQISAIILKGPCWYKNWYVSKNFFHYFWILSIKSLIFNIFR